MPRHLKLCLLLAAVIVAKPIEKDTGLIIEMGLDQVYNVSKVIGASTIEKLWRDDTNKEFINKISHDIGNAIEQSKRENTNGQGMEWVQNDMVSKFEEILANPVNQRKFHKISQELGFSIEQSKENSPQFKREKAKMKKITAQPRTIVITSVPIAVAVFITVLLAVVVTSTCKKLKIEKKQKQLALEMITEWKKMVIIEKPQLSDTPDAGEALLAPIVKIEKRKASQPIKDMSDTTLMSEYEMPADIDWEVPRETLVLGTVLGEGEFGKVVKADRVEILNQGQYAVAVKMLKEYHTDDDMMALVSEMEIMKIVGKHVNIVNLLGCCTQNGPLYVITEFALHGCLKDFLRKRRPEIKHMLPKDGLEEKGRLTQDDLVSFSYQVAKGMEYLASKRNDLMLTIRACLTRSLENNGNYNPRGLPARKKYQKKGHDNLIYKPLHLLIDGQGTGVDFSVAVESWSFGVLMWEIMTLGATPYPCVKGQYLYEHLKTGHRLRRPPYCRIDIYMLMRECWSFCPKDRPSFSELVEDLDKILTVTADHKDLDFDVPQPSASLIMKTRWLS